MFRARKFTLEIVSRSLCWWDEYGKWVTGPTSNVASVILTPWISAASELEHGGTQQGNKCSFSVFRTHPF